MRRSRCRKTIPERRKQSLRIESEEPFGVAVEPGGDRTQKVLGGVENEKAREGAARARNPSSARAARTHGRAAGVEARHHAGRLLRVRVRVRPAHLARRTTR